MKEIDGAPDNRRPLAGQEDLNRGDSVALSPPPGDIVTSGKDTSIIEVRSRCAEGEVINIVLGIELEGQSNVSQDSVENALVYPSVRALIDWGIGGTKFRAECDYLLGTQLSIAAENIRVGARYLKNSPPWQPVAEAQAPTFRCAAAFSYGASGRNSNSARLTELVQVETPQSPPVRIQIPQYAISFTILPVDDSIVQADVFGFGTSYFVRYNVGVPISNVGQHNVENTFPIFNGARFIEITNQNEEGPLYAFVIFGLAL